MKPYGWKRLSKFRECPCCDGLMRGKNKKIRTKQANRTARQEVKPLLKRQTLGEQLIESLNEALNYETYLQEEKDARNYPGEERLPSKTKAKTTRNKKARQRKRLQSKTKAR
jgi:hypothetical protein